MVELKDLSEIMQKIIAAGATFMASASGLPKHYNLYAAYHSGINNKSVHLTFHEKDGIVVQAADLEHPVIEFCDADSVVAYMLKEVGAV